LVGDVDDEGARREPASRERGRRLLEELAVHVGERDSRAAVGEHLGHRETEPARRAGDDRAQAADVEEAPEDIGRAVHQSIRTTAFITSAGLWIAYSIASGACSSGNWCVTSGAASMRRRETSSTAPAKSSAPEQLTPRMSSSLNG